MKNKCKCISKTDISSLTIGEVYFYNIRNVINGIHQLFPYYIYSNINDEKEFATFSKDYFDAYFIDINVQRKQKLKILNEFNKTIIGSGVVHSMEFKTSDFVLNANFSRASVSPIPELISLITKLNSVDTCP
jgi:hypothetical protein